MNFVSDEMVQRINERAHAKKSGKKIRNKSFGSFYHGRSIHAVDIFPLADFITDILGRGRFWSGHFYSGHFFIRIFWRIANGTIF